MDKFLKYNRQFWLDNNASDDNKAILVEGRPFINQIIATSLSTKATQKGHKVYIWSNTKLNREIYQSFYFFDFIGILSLSLIQKTKVFLHLISALLSFVVNYLVFPKNFESFINEYKIEDIRMGDMIYDTYIRNDLSFINKSFFQLKFLKILTKTIVNFYAIKSVFDRLNISHVVIVKWQYNNDGAIMARLALSSKIPVISALNDKPRLITQYRCVFNDIYKVKNLNKRGFNEEKIDALLSERFEGNLNNFDVRNAYSKSKVWNLEDAKEYFGKNFGNDKKNVLIALHAFSDANHVVGKLIFTDYYEWFVQTMEHIKKIHNVNWIIKEHPSCAQYDESGIVENVLTKNKSTNIFLLPNDVSTKTIYSISDCIVTARGTVALEASCLGINSILAGESNFSSLGFTIEPSDKHEYFSILEEIGGLKPMSRNAILNAKKAYYNYGLIMMFHKNNFQFGWVFRPDIDPSFTSEELEMMTDKYLSKIISNKISPYNDTYYKSALALLEKL